MRLVTWNACRGPFAVKASLLERLEADIAVIQEIASPGENTTRTLWFGDNRNQGLAVVARSPYRLRALPQHTAAPKYIIPVAVEGPVSFVLFAVWTLGKQPMPYVQAASTAIDLYASTFAEEPVVMLGDFNSNGRWDKHHPASLNHSSMVARLEAHGLVSAYHHHRGEAHGREREHTFYLHWNEAKPYHIDFCFLPDRWASGIQRIEIGTFSSWRENSDHRPLLVDVHAEA